MRDLAGFALLLAGLLVLIFVMVQWVIPFLAFWFGGFLSFLLAGTLLIHRGRPLPRHLPGLLEPRILVVLLSLSLLFPAIHAGLLLLSDDTTLWPFLLGLNLLPSLSLAVRAAVVHLLARRRLEQEGILLRVLRDQVTEMRDALQVVLDRLELAAATRPEPEAWELVAGEALGITEVLLGDVERLIERATALAPRIEDLVAEIEPVVGAFQPGRAAEVSRKCRVDWEGRRRALQEETDALLKEAENCLGESPGKAFSTWVP